MDVQHIQETPKRNKYFQVINYKFLNESCISRMICCVHLFYFFLNHLQMSVQITRLLFLVSCTQALQIVKYWFRLCNIEIQVTQLVSIIHTYLFLSIIDVNCVIHMNVPRLIQRWQHWNDEIKVARLYCCLFVVNGSTSEKILVCFWKLELVIS